MTRLLIPIITFMFCLCHSSFAQDKEETGELYDFYCIITLYDAEFHKDKTARIDFDDYNGATLCDNNGEIIYFRNHAQMMTFMSKLGWIYIHCDPQDYRNMIFKKKVKNFEEARKGLYFKKGIKDAKKTKQKTIQG